MNISVDARVKAHISTEYVDADGRGTAAKPRPACLAPPEEFQHALQREEEDGHAIEQLEAHLAALSAALDSRTAKERERAQEQLHHRNASLRDLTAPLHDKRVALREQQHIEDGVMIGNAFVHRNDSDSAMKLYKAVSSHRSEAAVREREDAVSKRYANLKKLQEGAQRAQQHYVDDETRRQERLASLETVIIERRAEQRATEEAEARRIKGEEEAKAANARRRLQLDYDKAKAQRAMEAQLAENIFVAQQKIRAEREESLHARAMAKQRDLEALSAQSHDAKLSAEYSTLKQLEQQFDRNAHDVRRVIEDRTGKGSRLAMLYDAAHATAEEKGIVFHGLQALAGATLTATPLTPSKAAAPSSTALTGSMATQTIMSSFSNRKGH